MRIGSWPLSLFWPGWRPRMDSKKEMLTGVAGPPGATPRWSRSARHQAATALQRHLDPAPRLRLGRLVLDRGIASAAIDLSDVYVTDATFAGGGTYYYNIVTGLNAGGGGFGDFHARFPAGATIASAELQTVSLAGSDAFAVEALAISTALDMRPLMERVLSRREILKA